MTTKEMLLETIEQMDEDELKWAYSVIKKAQVAKSEPNGKGFLQELAEIKIDGPKDFASNLDLYLSGEKQIEPDIS